MKVRAQQGNVTPPPIECEAVMRPRNLTSL
jgi:hypothetical protein